MYFERQNRRLHTRELSLFFGTYMCMSKFPATESDMKIFSRIYVKWTTACIWEKSYNTPFFVVVVVSKKEEINTFGKCSGIWTVYFHI